MKKFVRLLIIGCLLLIALIPNTVYASTISSSPVEWQDITLSDEEFERALQNNPNNGITPYATGLITNYAIALTKSGTTLIITGRTTGNADVKKCGFTVITIQRKKASASSWSTYAKYEDLYNESNMYKLSKKINVTSGYQYRVTCTHYAKKNLLSTQKINNTSNTLSF